MSGDPGRRLTQTVRVEWDNNAHGKRSGDWVLRFSDREFVGWRGILRYLEQDGGEVVSVIAEHADRVMGGAGWSGGFDVQAYRIFYRVLDRPPDKADWYEDPTGRFEYRYWDGKGWTDDVSQQGVHSQDPMPSS